MSLYKKIREFQEKLPDFSTVAEMKSFLKKKHLRLSITIVSSGFSCLDYEVTKETLSGVLKLSLKTKVFDAFNPSRCASSFSLTPISIETPKDMQQKEFLGIFTDAFRESVKRLKEVSILAGSKGGVS